MSPTIGEAQHVAHLTISVSGDFDFSASYTIEIGAEGGITQYVGVPAERATAGLAHFDLTKARHINAPKA